MCKFGENRIIFLTVCFYLSFVLTTANYYRLASDMPEEAVQVEAQRSDLTVSAGECQGTIYDRDMQPLVNREEKYIAVAVPSAIDCEEAATTALDREAFLSSCEKGRPFAYECRKDTTETEGITVFTIPVRYSGEQLAQHIIGYTSEGTGVSGIEYAYDALLRGNGSENSVTYAVDGSGRVMMGRGKTVIRSRRQDTGVVLTIDSRIQSLCEDCGKDIRKGAIIVSEVGTGEILALVSLPQYSRDDIGAALENKDLPLINRALYSYSVGSVFKLVTACEGIQEGWDNGVYECTGSKNICGQLFNCHKYDGHGLQTMTDALVNSCNTYFIDLSSHLDVHRFRQLASDFGFGRENMLCAGMTSSAGVLPTAEELLIPAELANFSFGQGRLTATPIQINQLTAAIAGGGVVHQLTLVKGLTADGRTVTNEKRLPGIRVIDRYTAEDLKKMMVSAVRENKSSNAYARGIRSGAKTSTAQTGRYDENGEELCHGWITGFYPADSPEYAITILAEDGGYGNESAAPVFRDITKGLKKLSQVDTKQ